MSTVNYSEPNKSGIPDKVFEEPKSPYANITFKPTQGLLDAIDKLSQAEVFLNRLQRASSRKALNALDQAMQSGPAREKARTEILDAIGFFKREIEAWLKSQYESDTQTPKD